MCVMKNLIILFIQPYQIMHLWAVVLIFGREQKAYQACSFGIKFERMPGGRYRMATRDAEEVEYGKRENNYDRKIGLGCHSNTFNASRS